MISHELSLMSSRLPYRSRDWIELQNIALLCFPFWQEFCHCVISPFLVHSTSFPNLLQIESDHIDSVSDPQFWWWLWFYPCLTLHTWLMLTFTVCCYKTFFLYTGGGTSHIYLKKSFYTAYTVGEKFTHDLYIVKLSRCTPRVKIHPWLVHSETVTVYTKDEN